VADDIAAQHFERVEAIESPEAKNVLAADKIRSLWRSVLADIGTYVRRGSPVTASVTGNDLFDYPITFQHGKAHLQVTIDASGKVTGLVVRPGDPTGQFGK
jgi:hypothetical protein